MVLVFRLLRQFSDQFFSQGKLVLASHKTVCLSLCALLARTIDDPVAVYESLEVVLCVTAVIYLASSILTTRRDARFLGPRAAQRKRAATFVSARKFTASKSATGCFGGRGEPAAILNARRCRVVPQQDSDRWRFTHGPHAAARNSPEALRVDSR